MNEKKTGLEAFVERHRADFDVFEPRPNLWDDIELELTLPEAAEQVAPLKVVPLYAPQPTETTAASLAPDTAVRSARPYGIAAAVAALLMVGGWFWQHSSEATHWTRNNQVTVARPATAASEEPPLAASSAGLLATPATAGPEQRLAGAVHRMETYYATQITERQQELQALDKEAPATAPRADWQQELKGLDSTYQQLRAELYRNPEPEVVLDAMDRNLQIRLDLLNQQLRTREQIRDYHSQPFIATESRRTP
ncbi:hypothetical protein MUN84_07680 [Hymenobacter sp. 5516J-16]|uniref:hypothetical protein n=1 Tax=Hymenobacter sp. 5516J-16 TaxID=2932253 RepID=UPI001FD527DE|nr:hypothetical protein [Hymenobacter sp. 5516J-16]UOQ78441.1 hypothetical protein MUN84_07680 [Hymenobacter sp. 5516J-16]